MVLGRRVSRRPTIGHIGESIRREPRPVPPPRPGRVARARFRRAASRQARSRTGPSRLDAGRSLSATDPIAVWCSVPYPRCIEQKLGLSSGIFRFVERLPDQLKADARLPGRLLASEVEEPWVLSHSKAIVIAGAVGALFVFALVFTLAGGKQFVPRFEAGLKGSTAVAALVAGALTWGRLELSRDSQRLAVADQRLAVDRDLTDRFGRAVEQLGHAEAAIRLGGVFALERFVSDAAALDQNEHDVEMGIDTLAAFAREQSSGLGGFDKSGIRKYPAAPTASVEAVRALGRFTRRAERTTNPNEYRLRGVYLAFADLTIADLRFADLTQANLTQADLSGANLTGATPDTPTSRRRTSPAPTSQRSTLATPTSPEQSSSPPT